MNSDEMNKVLLSQLVIMLATSTLQQLGKLVNPATNKTEINLDSAQATIDLLDMLEAKTRGNLDSEEERLMRETIMSLKLNFVETQETAAKEPPKKPAEPAAPGQPPPAAGGADEKEPKFRKTYG
jgi:hypothetical protein